MKIKGSNINELKIRHNNEIDYVLNFVKHLIKENLDENLLNSIEIKTYCTFCKNQVVETVFIDFNNNIVFKDKNYSCTYDKNLKNTNIKCFEKLKFSKKIDKEKIDISVNENENFKYLTMTIGEFIKINLSDYYYKNEFEMYGKKIYSEVEDKDIIKIITTDTKKGVNIYFENLGERVYKDVFTKIKLR